MVKRVLAGGSASLREIERQKQIGVGRCSNTSKALVRKKSTRQSPRGKGEENGLDDRIHCAKTSPTMGVRAVRDGPQGKIHD